MQKTSTGAVPPEFRTLVAEACGALVRSDADRLEELAHCCAALNGNLEGSVREDLYRQARAAVLDMTVFTRVLDATRLNLAVIERVRERRIGRLEYGARQIMSMLETGSAYGID